MKITEAAKSMSFHFNTEEEAIVVRDALKDIFEKYECARMTDLYKLLGMDSSYIDVKYGWLKTRYFQVRKDKVYGDYCLRVPKPTAID